MAHAQSATKSDTDTVSDLESLLGYNMKRAYLIIQDDFRKTLGEDGLSARAFSALSLVTRFPNITQSELARKLGIERSGLVAIVDWLEDRNLLARTNVPGDRRVQALVATKEGQKTYQHAFKAVLAHEKALLSNFTDDELKMLFDLLQKVRALQEKN